MPDHRTKRQKLEAMAADKSSPNEARIAQEMLTREDMRARGIDVPDDFYNPYGDVFFWKFEGRWSPMYTSNHFSDDDTSVGRKIRVSIKPDERWE